MHHGFVFQVFTREAAHCGGAGRGKGQQQKFEGYCTDVYVDHALDFIDASTAAGRPFLACVTTNAPHGPFQDVPLEAYNQVKKRTENFC